MASPLGDLIAGIFDHKVCLLEFDAPSRIEVLSQNMAKLFLCDMVKGEHPLFDDLENQLNLYFEMKLQEFTLPLDMRGSTFQSKIWSLLLTIPYGQTLSYGDLAMKAGDKNKVRAVGRANGENRIAIIVPCHRVIGTDGSLVGYAGELWRKKELLELERLGSGQPVQMGFAF